MREFLALPAFVVAGYAALAVVSVAIDKGPPHWLQPLLGPLHELIDKGTATSLLSAIATSVVTVTAITFSVLLLAVQQTAAAMTPVVFDQFLRRKTNQLYLGMFVGLSMFAFIDLASVAPPLVPAFGATVALALTIVSLCALMGLIYSTVDQMRPSSVTQVIHDHGLAARTAELALIERTRRTSTHDGPVRATVRAEHDGFVTHVDFDGIAKALRATPGAEVALLITCGRHVAFNQVVAVVRDAGTGCSDDVARAVRRAVTLDRSRDLDVDPSLAVTELDNIAWTAISSAKQNPQTAREAIDRLRDLLARWSHEAHRRQPTTSDEAATREVLPIVYEDSDVDHLIDTLVGLLVVCAESMQHDTCAYVIEAVANVLPELSGQELEGAEQGLAATLPAVHGLVLSRPLERALSHLRETLQALEAGTTADAVARVLDGERSEALR